MAKDIIEIELRLKNAEKSIKQLNAINIGGKKVGKEAAEGVKGLQTRFLALGIAITGSVLVIRKFIGAANQSAQALNKLRAISKNTNNSFKDTKKEVRALTKDGLLDFASAATAVANLLATGLSLDKTAELLNVAKDNAISNRQAHLTLSESVVKFTEGIRNENSLLTDSVGITKNYAAILKEESKIRGVRVVDLKKEEKALLVANGFIKEGAAFLGQAAERAGDFQGQQAKLTNRVKEFTAAIGTGLLPLFTPILQFLNFAIGGFLKLGPAIKTVIGIIAILVPAVIGLGVAFKISVGLIGGGIGLVIAGILLLISNWETVKLVFERGLTALQKVFINLQIILLKVSKGIINILEAALSPFVTVINDIIKILNKLRDTQISTLTEVTNKFRESIDERILKMEEELQKVRDDQAAKDLLAEEAALKKEELDNVVAGKEAASLLTRGQRIGAFWKKNGKLIEKWRDASFGAMDAVTDLSGSLAEKRTKKINKESDAQLKKLEEDKKKGLITEEEFDKRSGEIEKNRSIAQAKNERKLAIIERVAALAKIAFNTGVAVTKAIAASPLSFGLPWSAVALGTGAIQAAAVVAKPLPEIPAFQRGGRPQVGSPSLVGEIGPEIFVPDTPGTIIPNNEISTSTDNRNITINVQGNDDPIGFVNRLEQEYGLTVFQRG